MLKKLVLLTFLLAITGLVFGIDDGTPADPITGTSTDGGSEVLSDGGDDTPDDPAHSMESAVNIYIHVILRQPDGPPPPENLEIVDVDYTEGAEEVILKTDVIPTTPGVPGDWFDMWRRPDWPMYRVSDLDSATMLLSHDPSNRMTTDNFFFDYFTFGLWSTWGSKGIGDPDVNYYYVVTAVDSNETTEEVTSSPYPSNCVAEYDQALGFADAGNFNIISYPVQHNAYSDGTDLAGSIPSATELKKHDAGTQSWVTVARKMGSSWIPIGDVTIEVGFVYGITVNGSVADEVFHANTPGYIAEPGASSIPFIFPPDGWDGLAENWMMVPMRYTYEKKEELGRDVYFKDLGRDITDRFGMITTSIKTWDPSTQTAVTVARYVTGPGWVLDNAALPGQPMAVMVNASTADVWPEF
ncbi:MAG: hypothetical protein ACLFSQ_08810 [Candidatus Zixiibacteriota bacterium]